MSVKVFLIKGDDRANAIRTLLEQFNLDDFSNKHLALKANYNSADPFPASTHIDTLRFLVENLQKMGAKEITMGERSGMGNTRQVLEKKEVFQLAENLGFSLIVLNDLPFNEWTHHDIDGSHWSRGFLMANLFLQADAIVQTCCLKTHQFGGHFTLSLKNSVGMIAQTNPQDGYDYMGELHGSPHQRHMIAEINTIYEPAIILMDGIKAFTKGGPAYGHEITPNLLLASTDRVAIDAVGVAILRHFETTSEVTTGAIFEQAQIARAVELGVGVQSFSEIQFEALDANSEKMIDIIVSQFD